MNIRGNFSEEASLSLGKRIEKEIINSKSNFNTSYCFRYIRNLLNEENGLQSEELISALLHEHNIFDLINPRLKFETDSKILFEATYIISQFTSVLLLDDDLFDRNIANEITESLTATTMKKLIQILPVDFPAVRHNIVISFGNFATVSTELRNFLLFEGLVPHFIDNCLRRRYGTKRSHIRTNSWFVSLLMYHENNQVNLVKPFLPFVRLCLHDKDHLIKNYALQGLYNFTCGLKVEWISEILKFGFIRRISELFFINVGRATRPDDCREKRRRGIMRRISDMENEIVYYSFSILVNLLFSQSEEASSTTTPEILSNGFFRRVNSYILTNNADLLNDEEKMNDILSSLAQLTSLPSPVFINQMIEERIFLRAFVLIGLCTSKSVRSQCVELCCRFIYFCDMDQFERVNQQLIVNVVGSAEKSPMIVILLVTRVLRKFDWFEKYAVDTTLDVLIRIMKYEKGGGLEEQEQEHRGNCENYNMIREVVRRYGILEILSTLVMVRKNRRTEEDEVEGGGNVVESFVKIDVLLKMVN